MLLDEALSYLLSLGHETLTIKLGLRNTECLLEALGNPQKSFPSVQIAGTNGKGSTAVMLESICRAAGIRVGLFTSPHLISITERIRINGQEISEADFGRLTAQVRQAAEELLKQGQLEALPTFFEHVTAIALLTLGEARVELAILETGLGGRLDSTTAAGADIVAITPIAIDHEEYLGHSLEEIAAEKAAIIGPGVTAIVAPQRKEAREVILRRCESVGVKPRLVEEIEVYPVAIPTQLDSVASHDSRLCITFETPNDRYKNVRPGLRGRHQITNAATAIAIAEALRDRGFAISSETIITGIETTEHPGRLELWQGEPRILFDGAHNPAAARALRDYLDEFVTQPITMVFGAMRDKALEEMAAILFPAAHELILTQIENPRAASLEMIKSIVPQGLECRIHLAASVDEALRLASVLTPADGIICVTGSLYLIGDVQQSLSEGLEAAYRPPGRAVARL
jgi:dihydrofolate synthase/folylpolyglutamate synthase